jgi:hypothetical protein
MKKNTGRPLKQHPPNTVVSIGLQVPSELKAALQASAEANGRTLIQEILLAIRRSFSDEEMVT